MAPTDPNRNNDPFDDAQNQALYSRSVTAQGSIVRDVQEDKKDHGSHEPPMAASDAGGTSMRIATIRPSALRRRSMSASHQRSSLTNTVSSLINPAPWPIVGLPLQEPEDVAAENDVQREEESFLRDNGLLPPKHAEKPSSRPNTLESRDRGTILSSGWATNATSAYENTEVSPLSHTDSMRAERTPLLPRKQQRNEDLAAEIDYRWDGAVAAGKIQTIWRREAKVLAHRSPPLIITAFLQSSLTVAGVFTVGHLGRVELGAVSLGSMTASITGYATYQGLVTSLDTLCAQAYGSGRKELVGLQMQRTVLFLWCVTIPIGALWLSGTAILEALLPDSEKEVARLAGLYLKILLYGAPSLAAFEAGKRFMQAQGLFTANLYILLFCAPLNALMSWLFVWQFKWGFVGAPTAIVLTDNLLLICLVLYVRFIRGSECWGGFDKRAFKNWGPMIWLAIPGLVMVLAEYLAFEILTFAASWMSTSHLAAQAVLATIIPLMYQIPMQVSIAASTRIANLIGAALPGPAKTAAKIALVVACFVGAVNTILLITLKDYLPRLFTPDEDVRRLVSNVLPICVAFQFYDALAASCNGILRGIGRQRFGGCVCLLAYYTIGIPISFGAGFGLHWQLYGLWAGPAVALFLVASIESTYIYHTSWERVVEEAAKRNAMGLRA